MSDSLSLVGDPRLRKYEDEKYSVDSGYFSYCCKNDVCIGTNVIPKRDDDAKPVLPYIKSTISIGPLWVANYLVTNEQFSNFWEDSSREKYYYGSGSQWVSKDPHLLERISDVFNLTAERNFWKDLKAENNIKKDRIVHSIIDVARKRAIGEERLPLWDETQVDARFSSRGNPVVGVTWWDAMAFCQWWTETVLPKAGFPENAYASLPTDWEWEGIRRLFLDESKDYDNDIFEVDRFDAHLRRASNEYQDGRSGNIMRPLHVGLFPLPVIGDSAPFDLVGNVWEWTRSKVFGEIKPIPNGQAQELSCFGNTCWSDIDKNYEQNPHHPGRDSSSEVDDLTYRAVRGGSFLSIDKQASWHPAYRLCDPPFASYYDLGFRIAIYPGNK